MLQGLHTTCRAALRGLYCCLIPVLISCQSAMTVEVGGEEPTVLTPQLQYVRPVVKEEATASPKVCVTAFGFRLLPQAPVPSQHVRPRRIVWAPPSVNSKMG